MNQILRIRLQIRLQNPPLVELVSALGIWNPPLNPTFYIRPQGTESDLKSGVGFEIHPLSLNCNRLPIKMFL
jgi:hypothetical protein